MTESKIELTERLRREGNWPAALKFKEQALQPHPARQPDREPRPGRTPPEECFTQGGFPAHPRKGMT